MDEKRLIRVPQMEPIKDNKLYENFRDMLAWTAEEYDDAPVYIIKTKRETSSSPAEYKKITFRAHWQDIVDLGTEFMKMGFVGKRLAIIGKNRYEWMLGYYAQLCGLGITVPLDRGLPEEELLQSLEKSKSDILLFDKDHLNFVKKLERNPNISVKTFVCMDIIEGYPNIPSIIKRGRGASDEDKEKYKSLPINGREMSIILFTSGTSALAKAVMLSQYNICHNIWSAYSAEDLRKGDVNMALLPYHHTFGSTGQSMMIYSGITTVFCDGLKYIQRNMIEYGVTFFICVPLVIEAMYKKIIAGVKKQGREKQFKMARGIGDALAKVGIDVRKRLFKEILDQFGGRLRFVISGASPLDPEVAEGFRSLGIKLCQGYGLTETSPILAGESPMYIKAGSIGRAIPEVELAIVDANEEGVGELLAKGDNVMLGYYDNEEATAEVMDNGWLRTGDLASLDEDGFLFIRGRVKNAIVLKNGKNIYPEEIEILIAGLPYVAENMVYGMPRREGGDPSDIALGVRIVYDSEYFETIYGLTSQEAIGKIVSKDLEKINSRLPFYKRIYRHEITTEPMQKTTTGKVKRYMLLR